MKRRSIKLLICSVLIVLSILTLSLVACDKPAGAAGPNPNNNVVEGDGKPVETKGIKDYIDTKTEFINTKLIEAGLVGYKVNVVNYQNLDLINNALDQEYVETSDPEANKLAKEAIEIKKANVKGIFEAKRPEMLVYTQGEGENVKYKIEYGIAFIDYDIYNTYCDLYLALTNKDYAINHTALLQEFQQNNGLKIDLVGNLVINRANNKLLTNLYDQYKFVDMIESKDGFEFVKGTGTLLKYVGKDADIVVPDTVNKIASYAFANNQYIKSVTFIGESMFNDFNNEKIGEHIFDGISGLTVNLPKRNHIHESYYICFESTEPIFVQYGEDNRPYESTVFNYDRDPNESNLEYDMLRGTYRDFDRERRIKFLMEEAMASCYDKPFKLVVVDKDNTSYVDQYLQYLASTKKYSQEQIQNMKQNISTCLDSNLQLLGALDLESLSCKYISPDFIFEKRLNTLEEKDRIDVRKAVRGISQAVVDPDLDLNGETFLNKYNLEKDDIYGLGNYFIDLSRKDYKVEMNKLAKLAGNNWGRDINKNDMGEITKVGHIDYANLFDYSILPSTSNLNLMIDLEVTDSTITSPLDTEDSYLLGQTTVYLDGAFKKWPSLKYVNHINGKFYGEIFAGTEDIRLYMECPLESVDPALLKNKDHKVFVKTGDGLFNVFENGEKVEPLVPEQENLVQTLVNNYNSYSDGVASYETMWRARTQVLEAFNMNEHPEDFDRQYNAIINDVHIMKMRLNYNPFIIAYSKAGGLDAAKAYFRYDNVSCADQVAINGNYAFIYLEMDGLDYGSLSNHILTEEEQNRFINRKQ